MESQEKSFSKLESRRYARSAIEISLHITNVPDVARKGSALYKVHY
jgi:hypothetical protein